MQRPVDYEETLTRVTPKPVAIAIVKDQKGNYNPITLGWFMNTSVEPPMVAISVGKARYSYEALLNAQEFTLSFPSEKMLEDATFYGTKSGRDIEKLIEFGTPTMAARKIDSVLFSQAVANYECKVRGELETGDHVIFTAEVVASYINSDPAISRLYILNNRLGGVRPV